MGAILPAKRFFRAVRCVICGIGPAVLISSAGHAQERCEPAAARVVSAQGLVERQHAGTAVWAAVTLDEPLCLGDTVRVGRASRAALVLANDSLLRLDQRTTLSFQGAAEERRSLLDLIFGSVYFFSHQPRALAVDTPFVNAAAEGTEFLVRVADDRAEVVMLAGQVLLSNPEGELRVASGDAAVVRANQAPAPMLVARPRDAVAWALYYPPVLAPLAERRARARALPPALQAAIDAVAANDYPGALEALDAAPEAARDARYWTYRAGVLLNVGRVDEATVAIDRALALAPEAGEALAQRAIIAIVQNRPEEALADARRAVELSPESSAAAVALSYALQANFRLEEAREVLRQASERTPDNALVFARLSEIEQSLGELGAAQRAAEQAVALAPELARTQMVQGFAALTRIDIGEAKAAFERAIALDSAEPLARLGLGLAIIRSGDLDTGGRQIEIAAGLDPNDSLIRSYLGKTYFEERRDPLDAEQYAIAKELDPNDPTPWFYNAIRLQLENRPVEALRELEKSIELNDNRLVYRSRLLLDQDLATRGTSLARIYDDLGFEQLGVNEAARALTLDPANSAAHRFLSDVYVGRPRLEVARVSELLQAQMLQPVGRNPIQPSLAFTDLDLVARSGPAQVAFNEFTPLFTRNGVQVNATGVAGTDSTFGDEVAVTGLHGRTSLSVGQFHYQTEGFRENNDLEHNIYTVFGQSDLTENVSLQAEYRRRDTDRGDRRREFDPEVVDPTLRDDIEEDVFRIGGRVTPAPGQIGLVSGIYTDREDHQQFDRRGEFIEVDRRSKVKQIEGQYLGTFGPLRLVAGAGRAVVDGRRVDTNNARPPASRRQRQDDDVDANNVYLTATWAVSPTLDVTGRVGYADVDIDLGVNREHGGFDSVGMESFTPGIGMIWQPVDLLRLRAAAGRTLKGPFVANQSLQPTQLAGFNERFDDLDGTRADWLGFAADVRASETVRLGAEVMLRQLSQELFDDEEGVRFHKQDHQRDDRAMAYLYWTPTDRIATSLEVIGEYYSARERDDPLFLKVQTLTIPLQLGYAHPAGWFATARAAFVTQDVDRPDNTAGKKIDLDSHGVLVDLAAGYRLPKRRGIVALELANLFDRRLAFQDQSFFTSRQELSPRFLPSRSFLATLTLNF
jgi:tetratricopeptide (TPR) repeat protein